VLITGWISAYIGTWIISPVAGIVLSLFTYAVYRLLEFIKRIF
jgi:phosphate/sulfate permease